MLAIREYLSESVTKAPCVYHVRYDYVTLLILADFYSYCVFTFFAGALVQSNKERSVETRHLNPTGMHLTCAKKQRYWKKKNIYLYFKFWNAARSSSSTKFLFLIPEKKWLFTINFIKKMTKSPKWPILWTRLSFHYHFSHYCYLVCYFKVLNWLKTSQHLKMRTIDYSLTYSSHCNSKTKRNMDIS